MVQIVERPAGMSQGTLRRPGVAGKSGVVRPLDGRVVDGLIRRRLWTADLVEAEMIMAGDVLRRLPDFHEIIWLTGKGTTMPTPIRTFWEAYGMEKPRVTPAPPSAARISDMDRALGWLLWLGSVPRSICMARLLCGVKWRPICDYFGFTRQTGHNHVVKSMRLIAGKLGDSPS